jgi:protein-disulfide isomerase
MSTDSSPSKNASKTQANKERREAAREQARKLREAQQRRERRNRALMIAGIVAFIAVVAFALFSILNQDDLADVDAAPATASEDGGIPVGASGAAGTENEGAPVVDIYLDYQCHWCAVFEGMHSEVLDELATSGAATIVYHPISFLDNSGNATGFSTRGAQAAAVVADQAPEHFTAFSTGLYAAQGPEGGVPLSDEQIEQVAVEAGVPQDVIDNFGGAIFRDWVQAATRQASEAGVTGTPTIFIDGQELTDDLGVNWQQEGALEAAVLAAGGATGEPTADATTPATGATTPATDASSAPAVEPSTTPAG